MNGLSIVILAWTLLLTQVKSDQSEWQPVAVPRQMQRRHEFLSRLRKENYSSTKSTVRHETPNSYHHGTTTKYQYGDSKTLPGGGSYRYGGHGGAVTVSSGYSYSSAGNFKSNNRAPGSDIVNHYGVSSTRPTTVNGQIQLGYNGGAQGASINSPTLPPKQYQHKDVGTNQSPKNQMGYVQDVSPQRFNQEQTSNAANNNYNRPAPYSNDAKPQVPDPGGKGIRPGYPNAYQEQGSNYRPEPGHPEIDPANRNYHNNNGAQNIKVGNNLPNGGGGDYDQNANIRGPAAPGGGNINHHSDQNHNNNAYGGAVNEGDFKITNVESNSYMRNPNVPAGDTNGNGKVQLTIPTTVMPYGAGASYNKYDNRISNLKSNNNFNTNQNHQSNNKNNPIFNQNNNQNKPSYNQNSNQNNPTNNQNNLSYNQNNNQNNPSYNQNNNNKIINPNHNQNNLNYNQNKNQNNQNYNQNNNQNNQNYNQNNDNQNNLNHNQNNNNQINHHHTQNQNQLHRGHDQMHHSEFNNGKENQIHAKNNQLHQQRNGGNHLQNDGHRHTYPMNNQNNNLNNNFNTINNVNNDYHNSNPKTVIPNNNNNLKNYENAKDNANNHKENSDIAYRPLLKNNDYAEDQDYKTEEFNENDIDLPSLEPFEEPHPSDAPFLPPGAPFPELFVPSLTSTPEPTQPPHTRPPLPPLPPPPPFILNHPEPTIPPMGHQLTPIPFHHQTNKPPEQHYVPPPTSEIPQRPSIDFPPHSQHQDIHHESHPDIQPPTMEPPQHAPPTNYGPIHPPQPSQQPPTVPPNEANYQQPEHNNEQFHHQQQEHPVSKPDQYRQPFDAQPEPPQSLQNQDPSTPPPSSNSAPNGESGGFYYPPAGPNVNFYHAHLQNANSINDVTFQKLMNVIYNTLYYGDLDYKTRIKREAMSLATFKYSSQVASGAALLGCVAALIVIVFCDLVNILKTDNYSL